MVGRTVSLGFFRPNVAPTATDGRKNPSVGAGRAVEPPARSVVRRKVAGVPASPPPSLVAMMCAVMVRRARGRATAVGVAPAP